MSMSEALLAVAEEMEKYAASDDGLESGRITVSHINHWASSLRLIVKLAPVQTPPTIPTGPPQFTSPEAQHEHYKELARQEFRKKNVTPLEERQPRFVQVAGGPCDGDMVSVAGDMPLGAFTNDLPGGGVYQLRKDSGDVDARLYHYVKIEEGK